MNFGSGREQEVDPRQTSSTTVFFTCYWVHAATHGPLSQRESCCSVRMDGRLPMLLKMVKSRPIKSVATPAYSSSPRRRSKTSARSSVVRLKIRFRTSVTEKPVDLPVHAPVVKGYICNNVRFIIMIWRSFHSLPTSTEAALWRGSYGLFPLPSSTLEGSILNTWSWETSFILLIHFLNVLQFSVLGIMYIIQLNACIGGSVLFFHATFLFSCSK